MTPQKRQRLMFAVLLASVLFGLYMKPWKRAETIEVPVVADAPKTAAEPDVVAPVVASVDYAAEWPQRDPFTRPEEFVHVSSAAAGVETVAPSEPTLTLQGIMTVGGQMAAVIDGKTRSVGTVVSGWKVEKIEAQGVWVSQGGERRFVPLQ